MDTASGTDTETSETWVNARVPEFLSRKVDRHYERMKRWRNPRHILDGLPAGPDAIFLNSNDYLGIARHPCLLGMAARTLLSEGHGVLMSGVFVRGDSPQLILEKRLANFLHSEAGVLCQSGFNANTGLIQCLADEHTPVHVDILAHMSFWEGIRVAKAPAVPFRHNRLDDLTRNIESSGPGVILVDAVYSTNGSVCPLSDIASIAREHECVLVVDESHSLGTHGIHGEGMVIDQGLQEQVHFRTASLSKSFAGRAGFLTCPDRFVPYFKMVSNPAVFSSTLLPHDIAWLTGALDLIRGADDRRWRLRTNAAWLREQLSELGYDLGESDSQIISLESGEEFRTFILRDALEQRGVFGSVFADPATAVNRSLVRFSVHSELTREELARIVEVCREIRDEVGLEHWRSKSRPSVTTLH